MIFDDLQAQCGISLDLLNNGINHCFITLRFQTYIGGIFARFLRFPSDVSSFLFLEVFLEALVI